MNKKISKNLLRVLGLIIAYLFYNSWNITNTRAMDDLMYGVGMSRNINNNQTIAEKSFFTVLSPIIIVSISALALGVGIVIFFLRKKRKKNVKKNI